MMFTFLKILTIFSISQKVILDTCWCLNLLMCLSVPGNDDLLWWMVLQIVLSHCLMFDEMLGFYNEYHKHCASPKTVGWKWRSCLHCQDDGSRYGTFVLEQKKLKPDTEALNIISGHSMISVCLLSVCCSSQYPVWFK